MYFMDQLLLLQHHQKVQKYVLVAIQVTALNGDEVQTVIKRNVVYTNENDTKTHNYIHIDYAMRVGYDTQDLDQSSGAQQQPHQPHLLPHHPQTLRSPQHLNN